MNENSQQEGMPRRKFLTSLAKGAAGVAITPSVIQGHIQSVKAESEVIPQDIHYAIEPEGIEVNSVPTHVPELMINQENTVIRENTNEELLQEIEIRTREYEVSIQKAIELTSDKYNIPITPHADVGYLRSFYSFYLNAPEKTTQDLLRNDFLNPEDFYPWANGKLPKEPKIKDRVDDFTDQVDIIYNVDDPPQHHLAHLAKNVLNTMVVNDKNRVKKIVLSDFNGTNLDSGEVDWDLFGAHSTLPENMFGVQSLIHELVHASIPNFRKHFPDPQSHQFRLGLESGSLPAMLEFYKTWNNTYTKNFDFFKRRFYDAKGDGTLAMVQQGHMDGMHPGAMTEFIAMLCTDFVLPSKNGVPLEEWPEDVVNAVATTWSFVRHGNASEFKPMDIQEVTQIRQQLLQHYDTYLREAL